MSLRHALEVLSRDRLSRSITRDVLGLFVRNPDAWLTVSDVSSRIPRPSGTERILAVLAEDLVLDFEDTPSRYRLARDPILSIEVERFVRRVERHELRTQSNVARFRKRYHCP